MATKKKETETLGYLGSDAQKRIVKGMIEDRNFFLSIVSSLDPNVFSAGDGTLLRKVVGIAKDYYEQKGICATYTVIEQLMLANARTEIEVEEAKAIIAELKDEKYVDGMETDKEIAFKFFRQQQTIKVLQKGIESLGKNGYEDTTIPKLLDGLTEINKSCSDENDNNPIDLFQSVISETELVHVPTGINVLDTAMNGGIFKKQVGLLIAKTGAGKTTLGTIMCAGAALAGCKVVHIYFEEQPNDIAKKYYAFLTGMYTKDMTTEDGKQKLIAEMKMKRDESKLLRSNIRQKRMPNGSTQVEDIKNYIQHLIGTGFCPDMVFIDYFSCMQTSSDKRNEYNNEWKAAEKSMKKIEQMAYDLDIAVWVAEQTNRQALNNNSPFERLGNVQGSYRITQPASFILYLDRSENRSDMNSANLYMDKCRGCEPKKWENIYLNNGNLKIEMSNAITFEKLAWEDEDER